MAVKKTASRPVAIFESELLLLEYVANHVSLPYTLVFCRFDLLSITKYSGSRSEVGRLHFRSP